MVVGLNYRTAPVAVRERFWISENRRYEAWCNCPGRKASKK